MLHIARHENRNVWWSAELLLPLLPFAKHGKGYLVLAQANIYRQKNTANAMQNMMGRTVAARNKKGTAKGLL